MWVSPLLFDSSPPVKEALFHLFEGGNPRVGFWCGMKRWAPSFPERWNPHTLLEEERGLNESLSSPVISRNECEIFNTQKHCKRPSMACGTVSLNHSPRGLVEAFGRWGYWWQQGTLPKYWEIFHMTGGRLEITWEIKTHGNLNHHNTIQSLSKNSLSQH